MKKTAEKRPGVVCAALLACIVALGLFGDAGTMSAAAENAEIGKCRDRISQLEKEQKELLGQISQLGSEAAATLDNKKYYDKLTETIILKINEAEHLVAVIDADIERSETAIADCEASLDETRQRIKERARQTHEDGAAGYLNVLLGAEGTADFLSRLERLNTLLEYDKKTEDSYNSEKARLSVEKETLERSKALQQNTLDELEKSKAEFERKSAESAAYFNSLNKDMAAAKDHYAKAAAARDELEGEIEALMKAAAAKQQTPAFTGDFMWPLPTGQGYISCKYGDSDPWGKTHRATDIAVAAGTPIYASADGAVVRAAWHNSYGNYVLLDHGGGRSTLYAHCSALAVSGGQSVKKGQIIGYVGTTGDSQGNHLHFEFRINGERVNPLSHVAKGC